MIKHASVVGFLIEEMEKLSSALTMAEEYLKEADPERYVVAQRTWLLEMRRALGVGARGFDNKNSMSHMVDEMYDEVVQENDPDDDAGV